MSETHPQRKLENTLAICFHGDEGRGLKKGNTAVISVESVLGLDRYPCEHPKMPQPQPCDCCLDLPYANRFCLNAGQSMPPGEPHPSEMQMLNMKQHSYLTKFVLGILPNKYYKKTDILKRLLEQLVGDLNDLFKHGILVGDQLWFVSLCGLKGDLKWYEKIANLTRCFNRQLKSGACMCHECLAGSSDFPFQNADHVPPWASTMYQKRPWNIESPPSIAKLFYDQSEAAEMILKRDVFHNAKVGVLRDLCGSGVMLLCHLKYFHERDASNRRDLVLERAHHHFQYYCRTTGKSPALHFFTLQFFSSPTSTSFAWVNAKASDVTLMVSWLAVLSAGLRQDPLDENHLSILTTLQECCNAAQRFLKIIYGHKMWLRRHCAATLYMNIHKFLVLYNKLAFFSMYRHQFTGFAIKSKFHLLAHAKFELWSALVSKPTSTFILNPGIYACDMCEDLVGRIARLSRRVSPQTPSKRTFQLYFIKSRAVHQRWKRQRFKKPKA
eukprot:Skav228929  [mRNA]  locus=scaffold2181:107554:109044:- [translate_table: standard]